MCSDTKEKIAEAVEQMMLTKPVSKITVQSVMEQAQMKRQTFYYHYQDIYSVLEWIVVREICTPLRYDESVSAEDWCMQALTLLRARQPLLARFLPPPDTQDAGTYRLALDMLCYAAFCTLDSLVVSRTPLNVETFARNMRALFVTMRQAS